MMSHMRALLSDQRGDSAIQYALVAGLLAVVVLAGSIALREPLVGLYTDVADQAGGALTTEPAAGPASE